MLEKILIVDFGSQYTQLIARRVRELNVYCEIIPFNHIPELSAHIKGIILSGSPCSVLDENAPVIDLDNYIGGVPVLGICYGAQLIAHKGRGTVLPSKIREYGRARLEEIDQPFELLKEIHINTQVWMSHGDTISALPANFEVIASTSSVDIAAFKIKNQEVYGIQFHPEVTHTLEGKTVLRNFVVHICKCSQDWTPDIFVETTVRDIKKKIDHDKVVLGLSGGVDSTVAGVLINKAIGDRLHCIFVDNGLLRKNEF
jgi:GMP synthase (glutamine-hydrolysing)